MAVRVADPAPSTVTVDPDTEITEVSDDAYANVPPTDAVGAEIEYAESPYVLDTSLHDSTGVA
ncbi:MAG: hypothetical protein EBS20_08885 [Actinobacteria bacterium]|nr:hypothetical protein [Actinomycetota bacterium]